MKNSGMYRTIKGKQVPITQTEVKQTIMDFYGWNEKQYKNQYNKFRNSYLNYSAFRGKKPESVSNLLYKEVKSKMRYGKEYRQSIEMQAIRQFSSASTRSFEKRKSDEKRKKRYSEKVLEQFGGLIQNNNTAREITEKLSNDPVKMEQALSDYASKLHLEIEQQTNKIKGEAIPFSDQNYGSDVSIDFDIDSYL